MGDLCLYWNDILVSKQKINSKLTYDYYKKKSDIFIIDGMKKGSNISFIKKLIGTKKRKTYMGGC